MIPETSGVVQWILSILLFPTYFQGAFLAFAWGANDPTWMMIGKRLFLLLPIAAIILACWVTVASLLSVIVRQNRRDFVTLLFITWWDLGKAILYFWGGIFEFILNLVAALLLSIKVVVLGLWALLQEIISMPFRLLRQGVHTVVHSQLPWIAFFLTLFWGLIEATIFTYVTTPLVVDTFSNITGETLTEGFVRIPLFVFLFIVVLGSYAVLSNLVEAFKSKSISNILGIIAIEIVVLFVEVVFLYREFVDSLVPWFAQYSQNFELGVFGTLAIATFVWFGVRSLSWFLFAAYGTPMVMSIIRGNGLQISKNNAPAAPAPHVLGATGFFEKLKAEVDWFQSKGEDLLGSFILPPLNVVAAAVNFCMVLINSEHLFELPIRKWQSITRSKPAAERAPQTAASVPSNEPNIFGEYENVKQI